MYGKCQVEGWGKDAFSCCGALYIAYYISVVSSPMAIVLYMCFHGGGWGACGRHGMALRGGSRISLRGVLNACKARAKILKPRPLFEEPHRFACVFNGCFSYRSKNYAKVSEIKSLLATIHFEKGFY